MTAFLALRTAETFTFSGRKRGTQLHSPFLQNPCLAAPHTCIVTFTSLPVQRRETAAQLTKRLLRSFPELDDLSVADLGDHIYLNVIRVRSEAQGEGVGRRVVRSVQEYARRVAKPLVLVRDPKGDVPRLRRFYGRLGFRPAAASRQTKRFTYHNAANTLVFVAQAEHLEAA